ncbi:MAG: heme-binding protein [Xanthomonadales bacterium]|nr:heme-binding protein [Xanthomonadales bacterium]
MLEQLEIRQTLTLSIAKQIAAAAESAARENNWNVVVTIVDDGANLLYLQRMDGTQLGSIDVAIAKAISAIKYKRPTKAFEDSLVGGRQAVLTLPGAMPVNGGLPLVYNNEIVGAIGVSGVQPDQDAIVSQAGVDILARIAGS